VNFEHSAYTTLQLAGPILPELAVLTGGSFQALLSVLGLPARGV